jgi:tetratricopeptide (TPR) repeat protein
MDNLLEAQNKVPEAVSEYWAARDHVAAGRLLAQNGLLEEAGAEYRRAIAEDPQNHRAVADLASVYVRQEEPAKARPVLELVVKRYPGDADAWSDLAKVQERLGELPKAAQSLAAALKAAPSRFQLHYRLAQLYRKLGRTDLAEAEMKRFQVGVVREIRAYGGARVWF